MMTSSSSTSRRRGNNGAAPLLRLVAAVTVTMVLAQSGVAEAKYKGVNQFCKTSFWRMTCTRQVKGAINWHDAVKNCIESTIVFNGAVQKMLPQVVSLFKDVPLISREPSIQTCEEDFGNIGENLQEALGYVAKNDTGSITSYLSACNTNDCEEAFKGYNLDFPPQVSKVLKMMRDHIDNCLAVTLQN